MSGDDLAGVYKDADGEPFVLRREGSGYRMVFAGGSRHTAISAEDAARLVKHATKLDRADPWL